MLGPWTVEEANGSVVFFFFWLSDRFLSRQTEGTMCMFRKLLRHNNMSSEDTHTAGEDLKKGYDTGNKKFSMILILFFFSRSILEAFDEMSSSFILYGMDG